MSTSTDTQQTVAIELDADHRAVMGLTIPEALDWAAGRWADRPALSFVEAPDTLTYRQLRDQVRSLGNGLQALGVNKGDRVGIMLTNRVEFPLAWLGTIHAGAVAVPINPRYTDREVKYVLGDTSATWLITSDNVLASRGVTTFAPVPDSSVIVVGAATTDRSVPFDSLLKSTSSSSAPAPAADVLDLVGIQFTSGSTGLPKGCMVSHRYWVDGGVNLAALFHNPQHILADHPFHYMQNQAYFFKALAGGGQLHITPGLSRRKFLQWLIDHEIDYAWIGEGMLDLPASKFDNKLSLKLAPVDGITPELHRALEERFGIKARELYASTEVQAGTFVPFARDDLVGSGSMGLALPNRETKIVDGELHDLSVGQSGELLIRGPGMMLGYWNRPEANAELMLPDGWFRTGDIVRKDADGLHYYIGRMRDSIRRSGENIAAVEVEQQLLAMPEISEVAVIAVPDDDRGEEVKAIVVPLAGAQLTAQDVVSFARARLAPFKVPRYIEFRKTLPRLESGKIAKTQLKGEPPFGPRVLDTVTA